MVRGGGGGEEEGVDAAAAAVVGLGEGGVGAGGGGGGEVGGELGGEDCGVGGGDEVLGVEGGEECVFEAWDAMLVWWLGLRLEKRRPVPFTLLPLPARISESQSSGRFCRSGTERMARWMASAISSSIPPEAAWNRSAPTSISFRTNAAAASLFRLRSSFRADAVFSTPSGTVGLTGSGVLCLLAVPSCSIPPSVVRFPFAFNSSSGRRSV